jgi:hypothetical protein
MEGRKMSKHESIIDIIKAGEKRLHELDKRLEKSRAGFLQAMNCKEKNLYSDINSIIDNYLAEKRMQEG